MKNKPQPPDAVFHSVSALLPHRIRVYALHPGIVKMRIHRLLPSVHRFRPRRARVIPDQSQHGDRNIRSEKHRENRR